MKAFTYRIASSEETAVKFLGEKANTLAIAGGTSVLNLMKEYVLAPEVLVNIRNVAGTDKIEASGGGLKIGANVTLAEILENDTVRKQYPALAQALETLATPQIRNMATLGGNLCARPACWYFSHGGFTCLKRGGPTCPAKEGENEQHAIFATDGPCVMVHASSAAPALIALGASVRIAGAQGAREIPLEDFFALPKADVTRENVLKPGEILTHVMLGAARPHSASYEVRHKESHDWPVSLASVALDMEGDTCKGARICLGAVAPIPWRVPAAEAALAGKKITAATAGEAADAAVMGAAPLSQNGFKVKTAHTAVKRAILVAATGKWS